MNDLFLPPLPARIFRMLFHRWRPRGYMRLGTWMARLYPPMQNVRVPFDDEVSLSLDLRKIDHQPIFLDGKVNLETEERDLLAGLVTEGGVAIDVGANLGIYALTLARLVGRNGRVLAYDPDAADLLVNSSTLPQVFVRPFAVSYTEEKVFFRRERSTALSRIVSAEEASSKDLPITCVTIDAEVSGMNLDRVDFLKIDIEGAEEFALRGARMLISGTCPPVILFEWIPGFRSRWDRGALAVLRDIVRSDWRLFRVGWGQPIMEIKEFQEPDREANIVAFPPSRGAALNRFLKHTGLSAAISLDKREAI